MVFHKVLTAKYSPKNKCFADDGELLIIAQTLNKMKGKLPDEHHFFVGINSHEPSMYGWVTRIDSAINEEELAQKYDANPSADLIQSCRLLLESIRNQKEGTPMACTFSTIGIIEKRRQLKVHKVIFYKLEQH